MDGPKVVYSVSSAKVDSTAIFEAIRKTVGAEKIVMIEFVFRRVVEPYQSIFRVELRDEEAASRLLGREIEGHRFVTTWQKEANAAPRRQERALQMITVDM